MRKVILQEFLSLDSLAAGKNDSVDFVQASTRGDKSFGDGQMKLLDSVDTMVLGRVTYQMFAGYWPNVKEGDDKPFADKLNSIPKIVFSRTLDSAPWGHWKEAKVVRDDAAREITKLKEASGKNMVVWGSISLAQALIKAGLVDEYRLVMCPIVLSKGKPMFLDKVNSFDLKLIDSRSFDLGAVQLTYEKR